MCKRYMAIRARRLKKNVPVRGEGEDSMLKASMAGVQVCMRGQYEVIGDIAVTFIGGADRNWGGGPYCHCAVSGGAKMAV